MRYALMTEPQQGLSYDEVLALARTAEESGFEAFFRSDHYASFPGGSGKHTTDAWATLAGLARQVEAADGVQFRRAAHVHVAFRVLGRMQDGFGHQLRRARAFDRSRACESSGAAARASAHRLRRCVRGSGCPPRPGPAGPIRPGWRGSLSGGRAATGRWHRQRRQPLAPLATRRASWRRRGSGRRRPPGRRCTTSGTRSPLRPSRGASTRATSR